EAEILAPKRVKLNVKDVSILEAVALLAKESGYQIEVADNWEKLAKTKITLDTGLVPFWEVFETICKKGGLVERGPRPPLPPNGRFSLPYHGNQAAWITPATVAPPPIQLPIQLPGNIVQGAKKIVLSASSPVKVHSNIVGAMWVRLYEIPGLTNESYRVMLE